MVMVSPENKVVIHLEPGYFTSTRRKAPGFSHGEERRIVNLQDLRGCCIIRTQVLIMSNILLATAMGPGLAGFPLSGVKNIAE
jgi:hypothetical protein